jgi:hypothetical protein
MQNLEYANKSFGFCLQPLISIRVIVDLLAKSHLEARVSLQDIRSLKDPKRKEAAIPILMAIYDIETLCWAQVEEQRNSTPPKPLPIPIGDDEDDRDQKAGLYPEIFGTKRMESIKGKDNPTTELYPVATKPKDAVGVISTNFLIFGDSKSYLRVLHCLGQPEFQPSDLKDVCVFTFDEDNEKGMLEHWSGMMQAMHCQWWAGYNNIRYDLPYIYQRSFVLDAPQVRADMSYFIAPPGDKFRAKTCRVKPRPPRGQSAAAKAKAKANPQLNTPGILQFDAYCFVKQLVSTLPTYKLSDIDAYYKEKAGIKNDTKKKDMPYQMISPYWAAGSKYYQRKLAIYCHYDVLVTEFIIT